MAGHFSNSALKVNTFTYQNTEYCNKCKEEGNKKTHSPQLVIISSSTVRGIQEHFKKVHCDVYIKGGGELLHNIPFIKNKIKKYALHTKKIPVFMVFFGVNDIRISSEQTIEKTTSIMKMTIHQIVSFGMKYEAKIIWPNIHLPPKSLTLPTRVKDNPKLLKTLQLNKYIKKLMNDHNLPLFDMFSRGIYNPLDFAHNFIHQEHVYREKNYNDKLHFTKTILKSLADEIEWRIKW